MQKPSDIPAATGRENSAGIAAMRSLSNTSLVEEAARKALSAQQLEKTLARFRELCVAPGDNVVALEETAEILRNAGFKNELMRLLHDALELAGANPHVGALWVRRVVSSKIWDHEYPDGLDALCRQGEIGHRAVIEFLDLAGTKRRAKLVQQAVARHGKWLRTHPAGWAVAGRALAHARCYRQAARWMSGWRKQPELDLPTLQCLALVLRATRRNAEADEVVRLALAKPGVAESFPLFKLWAAQDQAFAGDTQGASATLKQINTTGWDDDSLALFYLVRGVVRVQKAEAGHHQEAFGAAQERLTDLFRRLPIYKRDIFLRREYCRCVARMAKDAGSFPGRVRAYWRSAQSGWFILPLLVLPGLQLWLPCYLYRLCARRRGVTK